SPRGRPSTPSRRSAGCSASAAPAFTPGSGGRRPTVSSPTPGSATRSVRSTLRAGSLSGLVPKRYRRTTIRVPGVRVADDLVERNFVPSGPDRLWCDDIKYLRSWQGWLYLAAVMDCYSRRIVGWSMRPDLEAELVVDALEMA